MNKYRVIDEENLYFEREGHSIAKTKRFVTLDLGHDIETFDITEVEKVV